MTGDREGLLFLKEGIRIRGRLPTYQFHRL